MFDSVVNPTTAGQRISKIEMRFANARIQLQSLFVMGDRLYYSTTLEQEGPQVILCHPTIRIFFYGRMPERLEIRIGPSLLPASEAQSQQYDERKNWFQDSRAVA